MENKGREKTSREMLIDTIEEFGGDELERADWVRIAKIDDEGLIKLVISLLNYYHEQCNS